jgi:hypothetical protein
MLGQGAGQGLEPLGVAPEVAVMVLGGPLATEVERRGAVDGLGCGGRDSLSRWETGGDRVMRELGVTREIGYLEQQWTWVVLAEGLHVQVECHGRV